MADIGSAYLTIFPSMSGFGKELTGYLNGVDLSGAGQRMGSSLSKSISAQVSDVGLKGLEDAVVKAEMKVRSAMDKSADAAKELEIAQKRLSEARAKYPADSSQVAQAELRVQQAQRKSAAAAKEVDNAQGQLAHAQKELEAATESSTSALRAQDGAMGSLGGSSSGLSGKLSAITGAAMGVAGEIAGRLFDAVVGLGGEMVAASDSAQKFASTLSFAGIDDSTIQQLTASTQEYADRTVYDLADIRNVTAQLAANGVADYEQLAQAAGNLNAVAGGSASTFQSVAQVMTQTAGAGKLTTENWNQLTDAIPGASGALQDAMRSAGAFEGNFREAMENGEISAEEFNAAVMQLGMQDVAIEAATSTSTIEGAMGNLQASVVGVGASLIDAFKPFITGGIAGIASAISQLPALFQQVAAAAAPAFQPFATALQQAWTALAPLVAQLGGAFMGLMQALSPVVQMVTTYLGQWWATLVNIGAAIAATVIPILTQIIGFISGTLLPVVMPAIQSIFTAVQSTFPLIQTIITGAMSVIQAIWNAVWPVLQVIAVPIMEAVSSCVSAVMEAINAVISSVLSIIQGDWEGAWDTMSSFLSSAWEGIKSGVSAGIDAVMSFLGSLPDRIIGIFSGAGSWLVESGKSLLQGFADGVMGAVGWVGDQISGALDTIRGFFPFSPAKEGPFSGHGYTTYSGRALMTDFGKGIAQASGSAVSAAIGAVSDVEGVFSGSPANLGATGYPVLGASLAGGADGSAADALLRSIDGGIAYIAQLLPEALDPATRARFARGAVSYVY